MSTPVATPDDLKLYLGLDSIDNDRATFILGLAQSLCETIVTPLPTGAAGVVLEVATRAFTNPSGVHDVRLGSAEVQYASEGQSAMSGLYLSKSNKADLRRFAGGGGAFSIDMLPRGVDAIQRITFAGTVTGGTYTLTIGGQTTAPIAWNAVAGTIQTALASLTVVGAGNVTVSGSVGGAFAVTFVNDLGAAPVPTMVPNGASLTGTSPTVSVVTVVAGEFAFGVTCSSWESESPGWTL